MDQATELTLRDVLQQIDRRLTAVEEGLRAQSVAMATLAKELRAEMAALARELRAEIAASAKELRAEAKDTMKPTETQIMQEVLPSLKEVITKVGAFSNSPNQVMAAWTSFNG